MRLKWRPVNAVAPGGRISAPGAIDHYRIVPVGPERFLLYVGRKGLRLHGEAGTLLGAKFLAAQRERRIA